MSTNYEKFLALGPNINDSYHIHISSGGVVSVLAGIGAFAAISIAGVKVNFMGGVSGGSIVTAFRALGFTDKEMMHIGIHDDFSDHISAKGGIFGSVGELRDMRLKAARLIQRFRSGKVSTEEFSETWHATGLLGTVGLGNFIDKKAAEKGLKDRWPPGYWNMSTTADGSQVFFTELGSIMITPDGRVIVLSSKPARLSKTIRASSAIPIIMTAIEHDGNLLFDGAMSRDGLCPSTALIRHFGLDPSKIIACRSGEDSNHFIFGPTQRAIRKVWGIEPEYHWGPEGTGAIEFRPQIDHIHSLKFHLSADEKWLAILIAFFSCMEALAFRGLLQGEQLRVANKMFQDIGYWRDLRPAPHGSPQILSDRAQRVFAEHGLY